MAKSKVEKTEEKTDNGTTELTTRNETALTSAREDFIEKGDLSGTEDITADDLRLPRLAFAQGLSEQMQEGNSNYIAELRMAEMFNDLTSEIYGKGPMTFVPVKREVRYIEFAPREDGGGLLDPDVPPGDPRTKWSVVDGRRVPPAATKFVEFVVLLLKGEDPPEPIVLSIKDTNKFNRRAAERLTGFIKLRQKPIYAGLYTIQSKNEKNDKGTFAVPVIGNAGNLDDKNVPDEMWERHKRLYAYAQQFAASLQGKTIHVNRDTTEDDSFDTDAYDAAVTGAATRPDM